MTASSLLASSGGFWAPIANPLSDVLAFFYSLVPNYGVAIVLLTVAMMIVLTPLTIKQTRSMLVMQKLQPEMKKLQEQHKNDRQAMNEAMMALYKEHNASPLGGCLPMLLPFPLFIALYRVLEGLSHIDSKTMKPIPRYLSPHSQMYMDIVHAGGKLDAFGMNLAKSARNVGGGFGHAAPYFVLLVVMVATQFYQQYQLTSKNPMMQSQPGQKMMMRVIPLVFGVFSLAFPAGVIVYWVVSNLIRIALQWALYRYDPKVKALIADSATQAQVVAKTRDRGDDAKGGGGRPRFRDILRNASDQAQDRKQATAGKGTAKPASRPPAAKDRSSGRPSTGSDGAAKQRRPAPPGTLRGGAQSGGASNGAQKAPPGKPGAQKGGPQKAAGAKNGSGAGTSQSKDAGGRPAAGRPPVKPAVNKAPAVKTPAVNKAPAVKTPAVNKAPASGNGAKTPGGPGAGNGAKLLPAPPNDQASTSAGQDEGRDKAPAPQTPPEAGAASNGSPARGRTGAGNARTVSSHRRRKGR